MLTASHPLMFPAGTRWGVCWVDVYRAPDGSLLVIVSDGCPDGIAPGPDVADAAELVWGEVEREHGRDPGVPLTRVVRHRWPDGECIWLLAFARADDGRLMAAPAWHPLTPAALEVLAGGPLASGLGWGGPAVL